MFEWRLKCWSITHVSDTTADRNKSYCNHSFASCYTQDAVQVKICTVLYFAVSVMIGHLVLYLKIVPADYHTYCDISWKSHSKFYILHSLLFLFSTYSGVNRLPLSIQVWIGYHWAETVKFLPEYYPVVQLWGNTQTYQHSAHSVTSDLFYLWCIFDAFSIWHKFVL